MQKNFKVSVIIPIYNSEKYIGRCLRSLKRQSLNKKNYEIVIVDDCSKDNSISEIKKHLDGNIKIIQNKKNLGLPPIAASRRASWCFRCFKIGRQ